MRKVIRNEMGIRVLISQKNIMLKSRIYCDKIEYIFEKGIVNNLFFFEKNKIIFNVWLKEKKYSNIKQAMKSADMELIPSVWDDAKTPKEKKLFMEEIERIDREDKTIPFDKMMKGTIPKTITIEILPKNKLKIKDEKILKQKLLEITIEHIQSDADVEVIYDK